LVQRIFASGAIDPCVCTDQIYISKPEPVLAFVDKQPGHSLGVCDNGYDLLVA
jgi:hypothetical protein